MYMYYMYMYVHKYEGVFFCLFPLIFQQFQS